MNNTNALRCKRHREKLYNQGLCQICGKRACEPGHVRCVVCARTFYANQKQRDPNGSKHKEYLRELSNFRRTNGLCIDCGKKAVNGRVRCAECLWKQKEYKKVKRIKMRIRAQAIKDGIILGG